MKRGLALYDKKIRKWTAKGIYDVDIAEKIGCNRLSLSRYKRRNKIPYNPLPNYGPLGQRRIEDKPEYEKVVELSRIGMSDREIATRVGLAKSTVTSWRVRAGYKRHPGHPKLTDAQLDMAKLLLEDGCSHADIGATIGCDRTTIGRYFPGTAWKQEQKNEYLSMLHKARWKMEKANYAITESRI